MTVSEIMQSYSVTVNGGSGVLVDAMTQDYSYVLTAAHVITPNNPEDIEPEDIVVRDYQGNQLRVLSMLIPQEWINSKPTRYDFAVLKIDYLERISQKCIPASDLPHLASLTLVGAPETERSSSDPIKQHTGHKISVVNELIMMSIDGIPGAQNIRGMSGGGVYHVQDEKPLLIGVEFKMDGSTVDQQYGRAQCHSLAKFEKLIIEQASAPLIPPYLECFSNMRDQIFSFNVIEPESVSSLKQELKNAADYLINNGLIPPYKLMEQYKSDLLIEPKSLGELKTYELWVAYLEFLVINVLIDCSDNADDSYLKSLERKRRFIYTSDSTNWLSRLEDLLKTARRLLDRNGTLIVASPEATAKVLPTNARLEKIISNISVVPTQGPFPAIDSIDSNESALLNSYKLTHLEGLRNTCVVDVEEEYSNIQADGHPSHLLREKLSEIIN